MKNNFFLILIFFSIIFTVKINANNLSEKNNSSYRYKLGPGDSISIKLIKIEGFDNKLTVLPDGTINLARIGSVYISGMTLTEATNKITNKYKSILKYPVVYLNLEKARPIKISVLGEVQRPGIYSLSQSEINNLSNSDGGESIAVSSKGWPTVFDGLQKAGGVTTNANLKKINLFRNLDNKENIEKLNLDFWRVFDKNQKILNPYIFDGDTIIVGKANDINKDKVLKISKSNLSPATVNINVIGQVVRPGIVNVRSGAPLSEAIFAAGGYTIKSNQKKVSLFRLKNDGSIYSENFSFNPKKDLNNTNNPYLQDRDIVVVGKNAWSKFNEVLRDSVQPISPIISAGAFYRLFN